MEINYLINYGKNNSVFADAFSIRVKVFCKEQSIPFQNELDEFDDSSYHQVIYANNIPIACGRMNIADHNESRICRVAVLKGHRRHGYASEICNNFICLSRELRVKFIFLHAQLYVVSLYEKLGFVSDDKCFLEEGIPHTYMLLKLE